MSAATRKREFARLKARVGRIERERDAAQRELAATRKRAEAAEADMVALETAISIGIGAGFIPANEARS